MRNNIRGSTCRGDQSKCDRANSNCKIRSQQASPYNASEVELSLGIGASYWRRSSASDSQHGRISKRGAQLATLPLNVTVDGQTVPIGRIDFVRQAVERGPNGRSITPSTTPSPPAARPLRRRLRHRGGCQPPHGVASAQLSIWRGPFAIERDRHHGHRASRPLPCRSTATFQGWR